MHRNRISLASLVIAMVCTLLAFPLWASGPTALQQVEQSLKIIAEKDQVYNAVIAISPTAKSQADEIDNRGLGILGGMPILVKDNIETDDLPTTAGSLVLKNNHTDRDAPLIAQLKQAGGVILGKTNLSEWANFRSEKSSSGWSAIGGQTGNAYDIKRSPCGSSSGSAVAVALGYVPVAIGTETFGSIICPATVNGVVGFKPTHGLISGEGIVPLASSQDTAGPIANTIENAALVLSVMIQPEVQRHAELVTGLRDLAQAPDLKGLRVGIMASTLGFDPRRDVILMQAVAKLEKAGVTVVPDILLEPSDGFWDENYSLLKYEFKRDLNSYLSKLPNELSALNLEKIIAFNKEHAEKELVHFDQGIFESSQALDMSEKAYLKILHNGKKVTRDEGLDKAFAEHKLNAIIGISTGPVWLIDHINGDSFFGPGMAGYPAVGGNPHVTVPGGKIGGLPVGLSFVGERFADDLLAGLVFRYMSL